jgi:hypothetical protein
VPDKHNGLEKFNNFTCLLGVLLSDLPGPLRFSTGSSRLSLFTFRHSRMTEELSGNLGVYPGSHRTLQEYFRKTPLNSIETNG